MMEEFWTYSPSSARHMLASKGVHGRYMSKRRLTNEYRPDIDEDEQCNVRELLQGE